ncbi:sialate O-acetylesterase [Bacillus sp. FJAT-28004]|uniref:sialate O-acetylesterase n=1 Tax=Bacillus sp. FJAT-28004 TaxID=1679165 RepID=UPI0006B4DD9C|nr:sialate O-acetylesterase [Bacillus sp. FJAT-28004]
MAPFGVLLTSGPKAWEIVQQVKGIGKIELSGTWEVDREAIIGPFQVFARVVWEKNGRDALSWTACEMEGENGWRVSLSVPAGGLYRIETCLQHDRNVLLGAGAIRGDMIHHVGVGDLWIIAGQSNAAGYGRGMVEDSPALGVHLLRNNGLWDLAAHPFNDSTASIHEVNSEWVNPAHSPWLHFGKLLQSELDFPIGFIETALGGSALSAWNPDEEGHLYRNMIDIVQSCGGKAAGVLWNQGSSDCNPEGAETYLERFTRVVQYWRNDLHSNELPFISVQLNRFTNIQGDKEHHDRQWGKVREAQRQAGLTISSVYVIPSIDCPMSDDIHNSPAGNLMIGSRAANIAFQQVYSLKHQAIPPNLEQALYISDNESDSHTIRLRFQYITESLYAVNPHAELFAVEDEAGAIGLEGWHTISNNEVQLRLSRKPIGKIYVHGAYQTNPVSQFLVDTGTYLPMLSFYNVEAVAEIEG